MNPFTIWKFIKSPIGRGLVAALIIGALWLRGDHYKAKSERQEQWAATVLDATRAAAHHPTLGADHVAQQITNLGKTIDNYKFAFAQSKARFAQFKANREAEDERQRKEADHAYREELADFRRRGDAFARAHGVRTGDGSAPGGGSADRGSGQDLPSPAFGTGIGDGSDRLANLPEFVVVPADDIRKCATIAARLTNARDWALKTLPPAPADPVDQPPDQAH